MSLLEAIDPALRVPHPVLPLPSEASVRRAVEGGEASYAALLELLRERAERIAKSAIDAQSPIADPLNYLFQPDSWRDFDRLVAEGVELIYVTGANREGKTAKIIHHIVGDLVRRKCEWAVFHNTETTSINQQQRQVFAMLPPALRRLAQTKPVRKPVEGQSAYLAYQEATGFSWNKLIVPGSGSRCDFFNYGQPSSVWEGPEYDGMYFDEKVTLPILETSRFRRGRGRPLLRIVNFTPKWGFTPEVQYLLAGAAVTETRPAPLLDQSVIHVPGCPPGHMPYIMRTPDKRTAAIFFHSGMNPLGAWQEVQRELAGASKPTIMMRAYGWATKLAEAGFPKYGAANRITRARFNEIALRGGTRHLVADPGGGHKNWFLHWWFATPEGWHILYREWPPRQSHEEWALSPAMADGNEEGGNRRRHDWRPGPAQRMEAGRSQASYVALILELEGWRWDPAARRWDGSKAEKIARRIMDPRFGGVSDPGSDEGETVIARLAEGARHPGDWRDAQGRESPPMEFEAAPGQVGADDQSFQQLADLMDWREHEPLSVENCPRLYVVDDCLQTDTSFAEFVAPPFSTLKNALKDPIDCARYYVKSGCGHEPEEMWTGKPGGHW